MSKLAVTSSLKGPLVTALCRVDGMVLRALSSLSVHREMQKRTWATSRQRALSNLPGQPLNNLSDRCMIPCHHLPAAH